MIPGMAFFNPEMQCSCMGAGGNPQLCLLALIPASFTNDKPAHTMRWTACAEHCKCHGP
jgi:hypothetical protein